MNNEHKILIVEDSEIAMAKTLHDLRNEGYGDIQPCANGLDALKAYQAEPDAYSLVLLDFELPDIDGLEVARRIRIIEKSLGIDEMLLPIIVTSSYVNQEQKLQFVSLGVTHFFKKPISENCRKAILQIIEIRDLIDGKEQEDGGIALCAVQE